MKKHLLSFLLVVACAGCAHHRPAHTIALAPDQGEVETVSDSSITSPSLARMIPKFSSSGPQPIMISRQPAFSMEQGLSGVQRISRKPVVAMTQYNNWYWYATDVERDANTQAIQTFLGGYAVQKGGYLAWKW
jgi:hypothetical protein